mmetsp:Transcript_31351/g.69463  ORF Transcript_31351/g.69463 Transcript_31351/m.69463 type:complete len:419 (+) Transcript_31351:466-1722(+)
MQPPRQMQPPVLPPPSSLPPRPSTATTTTSGDAAVNDNNDNDNGNGGGRSCSKLTRLTSETAVVTAALEAELIEAQRRMRSGRVSILESKSAAFAASSAFGGGQGGSGGGISSNGSNRATPDRNFVETFESELDRTEDAIRATEHSIESAARATLLGADALVRRFDADGDNGDDGDGEDENGDGAEGGNNRVGVEDEIAQLRGKAKCLSDRVLQLHKRTLSDAQELRRIANLADAKLGTSCVANTQRRLESHPWTVELSGGGFVVILLSDIYTIIRDLEEKQSKKKQKQKQKSNKKEKQLATADGAATAASQDPSANNDDKWIPPSSFERVTTKYFVREQDLTQILLASVAELPLLVFGRRGGRILDQRDARRRQSDVNPHHQSAGGSSNSGGSSSGSGGSTRDGTSASTPTRAGAYR